MDPQTALHYARVEARAEKIAADLAAHDRLDTERFDALTATLAKIDSNVESLLASRSFMRGAWKTIVVISGVVSTIVTVVLAYLKQH